MMTANLNVRRETGDPAARIDRRFLESDIETASRSEISRIQEKRILELVEYAWQH
jgi:phenylacetate-coenzyme A ligase PaaK-like adenylate-forming protein